MSRLGEGEAEGLADTEARQVRAGARVRARRGGRGEGEDEEEGARPRRRGWPRHAEELRFSMVSARSQRERWRRLWLLWRSALEFQRQRVHPPCPCREWDTRGREQGAWARLCPPWAAAAAPGWSWACARVRETGQARLWAWWATRWKRPGRGAPGMRRGRGVERAAGRGRGVGRGKEGIGSRPAGPRRHWAEQRGDEPNGEER
jgi:hypothetical protein